MRENSMINSIHVDKNSIYMKNTIYQNIKKISEKSGATLQFCLSF